MFISKNENNSNNVTNVLQKQTICNIYKSKCYNYLENVTFGEIIYKLFIIILSVSITLILTYPEFGIFYFKKFWLFENMFFPKGFVIFYIMFNIGSIYDQLTILKKQFTFKKRCKQKKQNSSHSKDEDKIFGIPIVELLNHLFEFKHFKRNEIEEKFLLPRNQYQKLAEKMEQVNILKRGPNNSRILNEDYTREQIAKAFVYSEGNIEKLEIQHQEIEKNHFTRQPLSSTLRDKCPTLTDIRQTA